MAEEIRCCNNCKWWYMEEVDETMKCVNGASDDCTEWTVGEHYCQEWEARMPDKVKVLCPYCGPWNGYPEGVEMYEDGNGMAEPKRFSLPTQYWYCCPVCYSEAPCAYTPEGARAAALLRFEPQQRPLELSRAMQIDDPLWLEFRSSYRKHGYKVIAELSITADRKCIRAMTIGSSDMMILDPKRYGYDWRAWRDRPSEEDRKAEAWEA